MTTQTKKKIETIQVRLTEFQKNRIKILADKYAFGNMSAWIVHGAMNAPRKTLPQEKK